MDIKEYIPAVKYGANLGDDITNDGSGVLTLTQGSHFIATVSTGSATINAGAVTLLADSAVTQSRSIYPEGFVINNTDTAWKPGSGGGTLYIQDSSGTPFFKINLDGITDECQLIMGSGSTSLMTAFLTGTGGSASKGLQLQIQSSGTTTGNSATFTVWGLIK